MNITVRKAVPGDAAAACDVLQRSIQHSCIADHQNNENALCTWLANKTPENVRAWIASPLNYGVAAVAEAGVCGFAMVGRDAIVRPDWSSNGGIYQVVANVLLIQVVQVTAHDYRRP